MAASISTAFNDVYSYSGLSLLLALRASIQCSISSCLDCQLPPALNRGICLPQPVCRPFSGELQVNGRSLMVIPPASIVVKESVKEAVGINNDNPDKMGCSAAEL